MIASYGYQDPQLNDLVAPAQDAEDLARVLRDSAIGDFDVKTIIDRPHYEVMEEIEGFFVKNDISTISFCFTSRVTE